ncbi:uncharacterized protein B0I36DRAFT_351413 [Microdochium trichocladiopsis]|uniref:Uncharacterized protein n=1 Tax=Microdochium trichocladiopsis TaxID=1682393 RepID=A0A9P8Y5H3_9PEZI|nr:uncharacterized protein B0I36DRAFT_351413 [Microdochium trichocladiopsis]KAH7027951.1 hypothetical protein B0I36DRAFT_351413 [Microdochium trichocladiopsis]
MKFFNTITQALLLALPLAIEASPVDMAKAIRARAAYRNPLSRRDCPSQDIIDDYVAAWGGVGDSTVFYTGFSDDADFDVVGDFAGQVGGKWYESAVSQQQMDTWDAECTDDEVLDNVLATRVSVAIAKLATGKTYVLLGEKAISSSSVWVTAEWPILKDRSGVEIIAVNAGNTAETQAYVAHQNPWQSA